MFILLIDDQRTIGQVHTFTVLNNYLEEYEIVVARNFQDGKAQLFYKPDILYLDHNLGDFQPAPDGGEDIEFTGMDILKAIQAGNVPKPGKIVLVTSNASVRQSMQLIVDRIYNETV